MRRTLLNLYHALGDRARAAKYYDMLQDARRSKEMLRQGAGVLKSSDRFSTLCLAPDQEQIIARLAAEGGVEAVHAVTKFLDDGRSVNLLIIGPKRPRFVLSAQKETEERQALARKFAQAIHVDYVRCIKPDEGWIKKKLQKLEGALVWSAPK